jgi:hypothetical protein
MHILVHIYVSYAMLNNIFIYLDRISSSITRGYQLVIVTHVTKINISKS